MALYHISAQVTLIPLVTVGFHCHIPEYTDSGVYGGMNSPRVCLTQMLIHISLCLYLTSSCWNAHRTHIERAITTRDTNTTLVTLNPLAHSVISYLWRFLTHC